MLETKEIRKIAHNNAFYQRGVSYFHQGAVEELKDQTGKGTNWQAYVRGSSYYDVFVQLSEDDTEVTDYDCNCPAAREYSGACKHVVAVLKAIQEQQKEKEAEAEREKKRERRVAIISGQNHHAKRASNQRLFDSYQHYASRHMPVPTGKLQAAYLVPRLFISGWNYNYRSYNDMPWLEFRFGVERLYVVNNLHEFISTKKQGGGWPLGKQGYLPLDSIRWADKTSAMLYQLLTDAYDDTMEALEMSAARYGYYQNDTQIFDKKRFYLSDKRLASFFAIMGEHPVEVYLNNSVAEDVHIHHGKPDLQLTLQRWGERDGRLTLKTDNIVSLNDACRFLYADQQIYVLSPTEASEMRPLCQAFQQTSHFDLSPDDMARFFAEVLPVMRRVAQVDIDPVLTERYILQPLAVNLYIDYEGDGIAVRPEFCYGENKINPLLAEKLPVQNGKQVIRDMASERELTRALQAYSFAKKRNRLVLQDEDQSYDFLTEGLPSLPEWVTVYCQDSLQKKFVRRLEKVSAGVSINDMDLLEVTFSLDDLDVDELMEILADYRQKKRYHRLRDKSFLSLDNQQLQELAELAAGLQLEAGTQLQKNKAIMPLRNALYVEGLAESEENLHWQRSQKFAEMIHRFHHPETAPHAVPASLRNVLRDYQVTGFQWLNSLADYHLGGILADDMGLGKTLQMLAFLLSRQDENASPSLIVAPTSLMYNWQDEIQKFTPQLKAQVIAGTKAERRAALQTKEHYDIFITTYNMLKRDIDMYSEMHFRYCILDEAQHIKNPKTQNAHSVKELSTDGYFALTGTPIENTLTELWSIFDFLMPGYLLSHKKFKEHYEVPIVREQNQQVLQDLKRHVMPFILRRMKKDVLTELPDKIESRVLSEMTPKQEKVYKAWFIKSQKEFQQTLSQNGFGESRIKILAILTRLRQIACDPAMFLEDYDGGSGKLDSLAELVDDAIHAGHRLLIFSQFTTMLQHIGARLQSMDVSYFYLDGATSALDRVNLVRDFNAGQKAVFLISLKAGGTGLNLTGADMVVHFDPWWNPAVEDQATDRAYRLGQKNKVQVLKLIAKDTIEEKIYVLQQKKKSLIDQMIQPGETFLSKLSEAEIRALFEPR